LGDADVTHHDMAGNQNQAAVAGAAWAPAKSGMGKAGTGTGTMGLFQGKSLSAKMGKVSKHIVTFDMSTRQDFVHGFRKRKGERKKEGHRQAEERMRVEVLAARKEVRTLLLFLSDACLHTLCTHFPLQPTAET
jgi:hypothetical protein